MPDNLVTTGRDFTTIERQQLLGRCSHLVRRYIEKGNLKILDIGCGKGAALAELAKNTPSNMYYGLDPEKPDSENTKYFTYIQGKIDEEDILSKLDVKFDLIISTATFPYVWDKEKALVNIANALDPITGGAYIGVEPWYFGPEGSEIFAHNKNKNRGGGPVFSWDNAFTVIIILGSKEHITEAMTGYQRYDLSTNELSRKFLKVTSQELQPSKSVMDWSSLEGFLKVKTYNPSNPDDIVKGINHPFRLATPSVYLHGPRKTPQELTKILQNPFNYNLALWRDSAILRSMATVALTSFGIAWVAGTLSVGTALATLTSTVASFAFARATTGKLQTGTTIAPSAALLGIAWATSTLSVETGIAIVAPTAVALALGTGSLSIIATIALSAIAIARNSDILNNGVNSLSSLFFDNQNARAPKDYQQALNP